MSKMESRESMRVSTTNESKSVAGAHLYSSPTYTTGSTSTATGSNAGSRTAAQGNSRTYITCSSDATGTTTSTSHSQSRTATSCNSRTADKKGKHENKDKTDSKGHSSAKGKASSPANPFTSKTKRKSKTQEINQDYEKRFQLLETALEKQSQILISLNNSITKFKAPPIPSEAQGEKTTAKTGTSTKDKEKEQAAKINKTTFTSAHGANTHDHEMSSSVRTRETLPIDYTDTSSDAPQVFDENYELYSESSFQPDYDYYNQYDEECDKDIPPGGQGYQNEEESLNDPDEIIPTTQQADNLSEARPTPPMTKGFAARFQARPATGPKVRDEIADGLTVMLSERLGAENMEKIMDKYPTPENVPGLVVPKVNPHIWENIPAKTKSRDLRIQKLQKPLVKGIIALTNQMNADPTSEQEETLALLTHANYELNLFRREAIKPDLTPRFQTLCRPSVKVTEHLFGEDLSKVVKDMSEQQKTVAVTKIGNIKFRGRRFSPYPGNTTRPSYPIRGRGYQHTFTGAPFLGFRPQASRGRAQTQRGKGPNMRGQRQPTGYKVPATQSRPY